MKSPNYFLEAGWLVGWLAGWLVGWLVGWSACRFGLIRFTIFYFVSFCPVVLGLVHLRTLFCFPMSAVTLANFCWPFVVCGAGFSDGEVQKLDSNSLQCPKMFAFEFEITSLPRAAPGGPETTLGGPR